MFTEREVAFIESQPLARLATVSADLQPDVVAVSYEFDGGTFYIGGRDPAGTRRHQNILAGNTKAALIIDDLASVEPWRPRGIRIYGELEVVSRAGRFGQGVYHHFTPTVSWSWAIEGTPFIDGEFRPNKIIHR